MLAKIFLNTCTLIKNNWKDLFFLLFHNFECLNFLKSFKFITFNGKEKILNCDKKYVHTELLYKFKF